jgi:RNA polymerase sigma-54 factor
MVDEAGYLQGDLHDLALKLGASGALIAKVLDEVQKFDPPGVFARNLAECLALQLKEQNRSIRRSPKCSTICICSAAMSGGLKRAVGVDSQELSGDQRGQTTQSQARP